MEATPADTVKTAIEQALAISAPAERARIITDILKAVEDDPRLASTRKADLTELRETLTLREVSGQIGLSIPRIDQIVKGRTTGRRARKATEREQPEAP
ncbi:hypothetical protein AB0M57_04915 [Streptomyces sp. NPDC051597]|uniref:hypothetical protein n=1 Tax=Streptomyces sp. NPDC051597 TaxID=3155049 RepID=UPI00342DF5C7